MPGGLGAVEVAHVTTLTTTTKIAHPLATPIVLLFRLVTFWARIPVGWFAMRALQRTGEL